jgi:hypothetical protein
MPVNEVHGTMRNAQPNSRSNAAMLHSVTRADGVVLSITNDPR